MPNYSFEEFTTNNKSTQLSMQIVSLVHDKLVPKWWPGFIKQVHESATTNVLNLMAAMLPLLFTARIQRRVDPGRESIDPLVGLMLTSTPPTPRKVLVEGHWLVSSTSPKHTGRAVSGATMEKRECVFGGT